MPTPAASPPPVPDRPSEGHKGTFGTVAVVGGSRAEGRVMIGAPTLTARAALRAGAGLVKLVMPAPILATGLSMTPSATGMELPVDDSGAIVPHEAARVLDRILEESTVLAIGPGLGSGDGPRSLALRALGQMERPVVADADALNAVAGLPDLASDVRAPAVLTPHPGEFRTLARSLGIDHDPARDDQTRREAADQLAQRLGCVVVLKGARTVVSDGHRAWTSSVACSALGTAGTGDVLTGLLAGLIAQFVGPPALPATPDKPLDLYDAARLAVDIHGKTAELWTSKRGARAGLLATELADLVPDAMG